MTNLNLIMVKDISVCASVIDLEVVMVRLVIFPKSVSVSVCVHVYTCSIKSGWACEWCGPGG